MVVNGVSLGIYIYIYTYKSTENSSYKRGPNLVRYVGCLCGVLIKSNPPRFWMRLSGILVAILWCNPLGFSLCSRLQVWRKKMARTKILGIIGGGSVRKGLSCWRWVFCLWLWCHFIMMSRYYMMTAWLGSLTAKATEKLERAPRRKPDRLPSRIFQGRAVKLHGCIWVIMTILLCVYLSEAWNFQLMVSWWFGLVVWIPGILLWKGLLLKGTPRIPNHQPKPPINQ